MSCWLFQKLNRLEDIEQDFDKLACQWTKQRKTFKFVDNLQ